MDQIILILTITMKHINEVYNIYRGRHGHDRMVIGFTITCAISAYYF